jgi:hypothetical protein
MQPTSSVAWNASTGSARSFSRLRTPSPVSIASFERLVLDERKIRGLKLFRSAEFGLLLLIDKPVKEHLEAEELSALMFIEPEKWDGFLS